MSAFIPKVPELTRCMSVLPWTQELEDELTIFPRYSDPICMGERSGSKMLVPRACAPVGELDQRVEKEPFAINCKMPPRTQEQYEVIEESLALLKSDTHTHKLFKNLRLTQCSTRLFLSLYCIQKQYLLHMLSYEGISNGTIIQI